MKKIFLMLFMVSVLSSCTQKLPDNKIPMENYISETTEPTSVPVEVQAVTENPESKDGPFEKIYGYYLSINFIETFRKTHSLYESMTPMCMLRFETDSDYLVGGNGHEGIGLGKIKSVENQYGTYVIKWSDGEGYCDGVYSEVNQTMKCSIKAPGMNVNKEIKDEFLQFTSEDEMSEYLTRILFKEISGVYTENGSTFCELNGEKYKVRFSLDCGADYYEGMPYSGELMFESVNGSECFSCLYTYKNGRIMVVDDEEKLLATF